MKKSKVLGQLPICTVKDVIEHFAQEVARLQRMADTAFYVCGDQKQSSWLVDKAGALKELAKKWASGIWYMPGLWRSMTSATPASRVIP